MKPQPRYQPGDKIGGRYQVHQALMGGMGEVYLCLDLATIQPYALKTFQQRYLANPKLRAAFENEVATWVALEKHPNIVRCFHMKTLDDQPFMFLEWIASDESRGADLRSWLRRAPLDLRLALDFAIDICRGLIHANDKQPGIVHRDLKPENILVAQGRLAKITDFGLAKIVQTAELEIIDAGSETDGRQSLTGQGGIVGTPPYMAPEQWRGKAVDARTDIYGLGCLIYEMITNRWPYQATTVTDLRSQHLTAAIPTLTENTQRTALNPLLARCLAKQPDGRFTSVDDLYQTLTQLYEQCLATLPRPPSALDEFTAIDYYNRGLTYDQLQCYPEALADLTQTLCLDPTDSEAYLSRGAIYAKLQRQEEAITDFTHAMQLDPTQVKAYVNRGSAYASLGQVEQGLADLSQAITLNPALAPAYFNRGNIYYRLDRQAEALADYTRAIELDPDFASAYANRANTYATLERYEEAVADYTWVIQLDPTHERVYFNRGLIYATLQRDEEALTDLTWVIQQDPTDAQAYFYLGILHYNRNRLCEALPYLEQAASLGAPQANQIVLEIKQRLNASSN